MKSKRSLPVFWQEHTESGEQGLDAGGAVESVDVDDIALLTPEAVVGAGRERQKRVPLGAHAHRRCLEGDEELDEGTLLVAGA